MGMAAESSMSAGKRIGWKAAEAAIVLAAIAMLFNHYRSVAGVFASALLLTGWVIIWPIAALIKPAQRRRLVSFILVTLMAGSVVAPAYYRTTSRVLFRTYLADPIPTSVRILHSEYQGGMDPAVYLHFELNPSDLDSILTKRSLTNTSSAQGPLGQDPAWWAPQTLQNATVYYWDDTAQSGGQPRNAAWLWVNEAKTEAYFTHWNF